MGPRLSVLAGLVAGILVALAVLAGVILAVPATPPPSPSPSPEPSPSAVIASPSPSASPTASPSESASPSPSASPSALPSGSGSPSPSPSVGLGIPGGQWGHRHTIGPWRRGPQPARRRRLQRARIVRDRTARKVSSFSFVSPNSASEFGSSGRRTSDFDGRTDSDYRPGDRARSDPRRAPGGAEARGILRAQMRAPWRPPSASRNASQIGAIARAAWPMIPRMSPGKTPNSTVSVVVAASPPHSSRPWRCGGASLAGSRMYM